jgi:hypothetical protein
LPDTLQVGESMAVSADRATRSPSTTVSEDADAVTVAAVTARVNGAGDVAVAARFGFPPPLSVTR